MNIRILEAKYELITFDDGIKLLIITKVFETEIKFNKKMLS